MSRDDKCRRLFRLVQKLGYGLLVGLAKVHNFNFNDVVLLI